MTVANVSCGDPARGCRRLRQPPADYRARAYRTCRDRSPRHAGPERIFPAGRRAGARGRREGARRQRQPGPRRDQGFRGIPHRGDGVEGAVRPQARPRHGRESHQLCRHLAGCKPQPAAVGAGVREGHHARGRALRAHHAPWQGRRGERVGVRGERARRGDPQARRREPGRGGHGRRRQGWAPPLPSMESSSCASGSTPWSRARIRRTAPSTSGICSISSSCRTAAGCSTSSAAAATSRATNDRRAARLRFRTRGTALRRVDRAVPTRMPRYPVRKAMRRRSARLEPHWTANPRHSSRGLHLPPHSATRVATRRPYRCSRKARRCTALTRSSRRGCAWPEAT